MISDSDKQLLLTSLQQAHKQAALNNINNASRAVCLTAYQGSGNPIQALAAGLLTTGDKHAPIIKTRKDLEFFQRYSGWVYDMDSFFKFNGVGNSFYKDGIDPSFQEVYERYISLSKDPLLSEYCSNINEVLKINGKKVTLYPNAAGITAAIAILLNLPPLWELKAFAKGRIDAWIELMSDMETNKNKR